jgi:hypothetical protein
MERVREYLEAAIRGFVDSVARGDMEAAMDWVDIAFGWASELERIGGAA